ncbi:hypothetical protein SUGI_0942760 [Cryptomeria japonica]|uniref:uncharacterized protein At3g28850 n=1 Tax=Cryptomeria japonica TaxID=3369 RepID=UPI00241486AC|nr:uncharacterized protein At3g28850 [Cryptomeria japonica]GLJ44819.1 hypothetical protein SUGI_0942760 [Cryptomeria japonica]
MEKSGWWRKVGLLRSFQGADEEDERKPVKPPPKGNKIVVLYYTSSRVIKQTYAECSAVLSILRGHSIFFQERDVFISRKHLEEITDIFGGPISVPRLFVAGKYVGGFQRIIELNEGGELKKLLNGYIKKRPKRVCKGCGNMRYIVCFICNGSKKFYEEERKEMVSCNTCIENGLLPCPVCMLGAVE